MRPIPPTIHMGPPQLLPRHVLITSRYQWACQRLEIGDNDAISGWRVDAANPADSFSVVPAISSDIPFGKPLRDIRGEADRRDTRYGAYPPHCATVNVYDTCRVNTTSPTMQCRSAPPVPRRLPLR